MVKVNLNNIYKSYENNENYAVNDFNLEVEDQEFIVFVGPSGCGKSTTLRMIAGLEDITSGELYIDDVLMNDVEPKNRGAAMVFQNYALYPHKTVYENMAFSLQLRKYDKKEIVKRVNDTADVLGLTEHLDKKPGILSGGQRQRVALGRAIVRDAKLFLMDEPLSNLDAKLRVQMRTEILKLHHSLKTTTIYVTHDQTEAMTMADRIVIMKDGIIQQIGTPVDIYDYPNNAFVASFIGSPAMNLLDVTYQSGYMILENDIKVEIPSLLTDELNRLGYENKKLIFGIRPEDISITAENSLHTIEASVVTSELTGADMYLYFTIGHKDIIAQVDRRHYKETNENINFTFDMNHVHFFDKDTQESLFKNH